MAKKRGLSADEKRQKMLQPCLMELEMVLTLLRLEIGIQYERIGEDSQRQWNL